MKQHGVSNTRSEFGAVIEQLGPGVSGHMVGEQAAELGRAAALTLHRTEGGRVGHTVMVSCSQWTTNNGRWTSNSSLTRVLFCLSKHYYHKSICENNYLKTPLNFPDGFSPYNVFIKLITTKFIP